MAGVGIGDMGMGHWQVGDRAGARVGDRGMGRGRGQMKELGTRVGDRFQV